MYDRYRLSFLQCFGEGIKNCRFCTLRSGLLQKAGKCMLKCRNYVEAREAVIYLFQYIHNTCYILCAF